jgi:hypothetical protein
MSQKTQRMNFFPLRRSYSIKQKRQQTKIFSLDPTSLRKRQQDITQLLSTKKHTFHNTRILPIYRRIMNTNQSNTVTLFVRSISLIPYRFHGNHRHTIIFHRINQRKRRYSYRQQDNRGKNCSYRLYPTMISNIRRRIYVPLIMKPPNHKNKHIKNKH